MVRDLKVIEGSKGIFVAMPSRKVEKKEAAESAEAASVDHWDIVHPITPESREYFQKTVLDVN